MRVVVECSPCRARIVVILSLVGYFASRSFSWYLPVPSTMKIATSRGLLQWLAGWLAGHRFGPLCGLVASGHIEFARRWHHTGMCTPLRIHGTKFQQAACLSAQEHTSGWRGRLAQWWLWAMCITTTGRFTVSIILVVITTLKLKSGALWQSCFFDRTSPLLTL